MRGLQLGVCNEACTKMCTSSAPAHVMQDIGIRVQQKSHPGYNDCKQYHEHVDSDADRNSLLAKRL